MRLDPVQRRRGDAALSLTPLIDVVFMLLLFFMLATQFQHWRTMAIDPSDATGAARSDAPGHELWLHDDGSMAVDGRAVSLPELGTDLTLAADDKFVVRAQAQVRLQRIVDALDRLRAVGVHDASLGLAQ